MQTFRNIEYLSVGNPKQKKVYQLLHNHHIMDLLMDFDPVLVGTIPIQIDTEESDLDILCHCQDEMHLMEVLRNFENYPSFQQVEKEIRGLKTSITRFKAEGFTIEIFAQNRPVEEQEGYRHLLIEHQILLEKGTAFSAEIIDLKTRGYKTEPAFALLLGLQGDAYEELLKWGS